MSCEACNVGDPRECDVGKTAAFCHCTCHDSWCAVHKEGHSPCEEDSPLECHECEGKGGFVNVDSTTPGCDETDEVETCRRCQGTGHEICEDCDEPATEIIREKAANRFYFTRLCGPCAKRFTSNECSGRS